MTEKVIGIMGAMPEEIGTITALLTDIQTFEFGKRTYYTGTINGIKTVLVFSRWGKVAAATTVTTLIHEFNITELIFTGVAGAISPTLKIGDIVIAGRLIQHDMDARPLMQQFEIPLLGITYFDCNKTEVEVAEKIVTELTTHKHLEALIDKAELVKFGIVDPQVLVGDVASGDKFFSDNIHKEGLLAELPSILCVEMEGASVAQVCYEYSIPYTIIRTISDTADDKAANDFPSFIKNISSKYSQEIIKLYFNQF